MDLDTYKKAWDNQPEDSKKVSKVEIYKMTKSKSSSIVKWIFIIGLVEFAFWLTMNSLASKMEVMEVYEELNLMELLNAIYYINFVVIIAFLYYFYKNYSSISTIENTKSLMEKIIKTRKTVKYYVNYNVLGTVLLMILFNIKIVNTPNGIETMLALDSIDIDPEKIMATYLISQAIAIVLILLFLFLFYYLLYGILLKKLNKNHKELDKLEKLN